MKIRNRFLALAVLLLCAILLGGLPAGATTVSGTVKLPDGTLVNGTIEFILSQQATTITPPVLFAPVKTTCSVSAGAITACTVQGNDTLDPAGTFYKVRIVDQRNIILLPETKYTISGASVDLGTLPPTATATLVPPTGSVTGNMNVTGNLTVGGSMTAAGSTTQVQFNNAGVMAGDPELTFAPATNTLTTDTEIVGKWNNFRVVDGSKFAKTGAGVNFAVADIGSGTAGIIFVTFPGDYSDAVIALGKKHVIIFGAGKFTLAGITGPDSSTDATGTWAVLGQGIDQTTLFLANTQNRDVITSPNFGTLTGGTNFWGVFHTTIANLTIDANKANNLTAGFGIRLYGRAGLIQNVIVQNARQDGIWLEWNGTQDFTLPTGDLEWRVNNSKTIFSVGNGFTNKAQSDMIIHGLASYKNGGWGIQAFFSTHMSASNFFLNTSGGCNAASSASGLAAGFFGTDNECTSATGFGLQIDTGANVGSSVIDGIFGAPVAVKIGQQTNYITGQFVNSTTAAIQFVGAGSNGNFIEGTVYGNTGTLVDWNAGSPGGGNSTVLLGGTSPGGAATLFTGTTPTATTVLIDAVGLTGSPYAQFGHASVTFRGIALKIGGLNGTFSHANTADRTYTFQDSSDTMVGRATTDTLTNKSTSAGPLTGTVASGTATMTTALIGTLACGTTVTVAATGVATTDAISWAFNAAPAANPAELPVSSWPTANNVNFQYCNPTAAGVTPNAATLNWRVVR